MDVVPLLGATAGCCCKVWGEGSVTANFEGVDVVPLLGATAGCCCKVWGEGRVTANFGGVDVVQLQGAIVVLYGGGEGDGQLWGSGRGAIVVCHCSVPL